MSCGCAERARVLLEKLGYTLRDGQWYDPNGQLVVDDVLIDDNHFQISLRAVWQTVTAAVGA